MKLLMAEIEARSKETDPFYVHGYKVSVYDVVDKTVIDYKTDTGLDEFDPDCTHAKFEIYFVDETGINRGIVSIGFDDNIVNSNLGDSDLLIAAGLAA